MTFSSFTPPHILFGTFDLLYKAGLHLNFTSKFPIHRLSSMVRELIICIWYGHSTCIKHHCTRYCSVFLGPWHLCSQSKKNTQTSRVTAEGNDSSPLRHSTRHQSCSSSLNPGQLSLLGGPGGWGCLLRTEVLDLENPGPMLGYTAGLGGISVAWWR